MTTQATALAGSKSSLSPIFMAALIGLAIIVIAGHVQSEALHAAAHDVRHATGFPCH
ncbi:MAG: CbtB-domain containing protein [Albidovulum sp.]|nr:CbtB-domain containing protein [Albidovulum sp.]MDE0532855.1 CbtB-domain containing protein [Albidovulum sp.]